jgi:hypothetical protein
MSTITAPIPRVNAKSRPLNVSLLLTIRETDYAVTVIAPGPDNVKAYRLEKLSGDRETYDLAHTNDGLVVCDCKSYVATHEGTSSTCKHGSALVLMGLLPKPCCVANTRVAYDDARERAAAVAPTPDGPTAPAPYAEHVAKLAALEVAEATVRSEGENQDYNVNLIPPAPVAPAFDADFYRAQNAVAERRALWLSQRHMHTSEPMPAPKAADEPEPCCDPVEPAACAACATVHTPAADPTGDGAEWGADDVITLGPAAEPIAPARLAFADWIASQAAGHARIGGERHAWLARQIAKLAEQARFLDADSGEAFDDRLEAQLDAARAEAEARQRAACC